MIKILVSTICMFLASVLAAESNKSIVDIKKELATTKNTATAQSLIESLSDAVPQTEADISALGQLMDEFSVQGQAAIGNTKNPKLSVAIMKECDKQVGKLRSARAKDKKSLSAVDEKVLLNNIMNSRALIRTAAGLKNIDAIPYLRNYLKEPDLSQAASVALGFLGDDESLNTMLGSIENSKGVDLSGYGDKAFVKIVRELDKPGISDKRKSALINQIKGGKSPERKKALKELALKHKDEDVRSRSGLALTNSMLINPEDSDSEFLYEWLPKAINEAYPSSALIALRIHFPDRNRQLETRFVPILINIVNNGQFGSDRSKAADLLGTCKITQSLPYLKQCVLKDKEHGIRGDCSAAYFKISGEVPPVFNPLDAKEFETELADKDSVDFYQKCSGNDFIKKFHDARIKAFEEYKRNLEQASK